MAYVAQPDGGVFRANLIRLGVPPEPLGVAWVRGGRMKNGEGEAETVLITAPGTSSHRVL